MLKEFDGSKLITTLTFILLSATLLIAVSLRKILPAQISIAAYIFMISWLLLAVASALFSYREFSVGYLLCAFTMMVAWRIAALYEVKWMTIPLFITFISLFLNFLYAAILNLKNPDHYLHQLSLSQWQLVFVRFYLGFNFIPHFTEKLFAGPIPHMKVIGAFIKLGIPYPDFFVYMAGFCEMGAAIALCLGIFMRIGALCAAFYLLIATYLGHHFSLGFIWAGEGGGWEFATMWMILILSFAVTGTHMFSIDQRLEDKFKIPSFLKKLM